MRHTFIPRGVCSRKMEFDLADDGTVSNVAITGGCPGNTVGVARLAEGRKAKDVIRLLGGIRCGNKPTSCPDQFATALTEALETMGKA